MKVSLFHFPLFSKPFVCGIRNFKTYYNVILCIVSVRLRYSVCFNIVFAFQWLLVSSFSILHKENKRKMYSWLPLHVSRMPCQLPASPTRHSRNGSRDSWHLLLRDRVPASVLNEGLMVTYVELVAIDPSRGAQVADDPWFFVTCSVEETENITPWWLYYLFPFLIKYGRHLLLSCSISLCFLSYDWNMPVDL